MSYIEVQDITPRVQYTATSGQTDFDYTFIAFSNADLIVYKNETLLTLTTDYTVSNLYPSAGGQVILNSGAAEDDIITILRGTKIEKTTGWEEGGDFRASTIDKQNAQIFAILQQQERKFSSTPMLPDTSALFDLTLPSPDAGKAFIWNSTADGLENSTDDFNDIVTDATAQAGIATTQAGLADTARAAAQTAQGLAETAQGLAEDAQDLAEGWASKTDGQVDSTDYSSKAYAIGGTGVTSAIGASKEWAITAEDTEVTTGNYSALHHAAKAAASALAAQVAKIEWQGTWSAGTYNANDAVEKDGTSYIATTTTTETPSVTATDWDVLALKGTDGTGSGDVSTDATSSVDSEIALYDSTTGKKIKRCTLSGIAKMTSGVVSAATAGTDYAGISTAQSFTKAQRGDVVSLTYSSTITADFSLANHFETVLTGNTTFALPTNLVEGQDGYIRIIQDTTGSRTAAYAWCWAFAGGTAPVLSTAGASRDDLYYSVKMYKTSTVTISIATPGVVSWTGHGLITGQKIIFTTDGALPTGITAGTAYYVINVDADTFRIATSLSNAAAGTAINTSGSQSGTHTATAATIAASLQKGVI